VDLSGSVRDGDGGRPGRCRRPPLGRLPRAGRARPLAAGGKRPLADDPAHQARCVGGVGCGPIPGAPQLVPSRRMRRQRAGLPTFQNRHRRAGSHTDSRKGYLSAQLRTVASDRFAWQARASWLRTHFNRFTASTSSSASRTGSAPRCGPRPTPTPRARGGGERRPSPTDKRYLLRRHDRWDRRHPFSVGARGVRGERPADGRAHVTAGARLDYLAVRCGLDDRRGQPAHRRHAPPRRRTLRASVGRGFRAPTMAERFVHTFALGFEVIPNPTSARDRLVGEAGAHDARLAPPGSMPPCSGPKRVS